MYLLLALAWDGLCGLEAYCCSSVVGGVCAAGIDGKYRDGVVGGACVCGAVQRYSGATTLLFVAFGLWACIAGSVAYEFAANCGRGFWEGKSGAVFRAASGSLS